ncbi:MAG: cbb3-type cytochrome c oxidase subunit I [Bacteroidia bacterium]|nr:cbb3-type cytochrome c oxidase subunit I [Bacteroidia bacterium]MCO5254994.1 cbb3-type cytochrome c oxidase subunit I [Bacteroidota bacterium]
MNISLKRITSTWIITILLLFFTAIILGITMRFNQGNVISMDDGKFYGLMTTHGMTMIAIWAVAGMVGVHYLLNRYVNVGAGLSKFAFVLTIIGVIMFYISTFIGHFHAGWTFLYPLPFLNIGEWESWATPLFFWSLTVLGVGWLVWSIGLLVAIFKKYSLRETFAWQHLSKQTPEVQTPPLVLISAISLVGVVLCLLTAVVILILSFAEWYSDGAFKSDPLLMKNLIYFFGHTIANESLYLGLAIVYELLPEISGRPKFKTTWYVSLGWNFTLLFVLTAYFHHLYMDFVQPLGLQMFGQFASYFASIPSAVVTIISVIVLLYGHKIKWTITNLLFFIGITGWIIGGVGALIDSTISNNIFLHNTLWVPAHFHTYNALGNVLLILGFFTWVANEFSGSHTDPMRKLKLTLLIVGGFGFVLMFYCGGAESIPRRYSVYPAEFTRAALFATAAAWFAIIYLLGMILIFVDIFKKCIKVFSPSSH